MKAIFRFPTNYVSIALAGLVLLSSFLVGSSQQIQNTASAVSLSRLGGSDYASSFAVDVATKEDEYRSFILSLPAGVKFDQTSRTWSLNGIVTEVAKINAWGSPASAALIGFTTDSENVQWIWDVIRVQGYSHANSGDYIIEPGERIILFITGNYVSHKGIDYNDCQAQADDYCSLLLFVEGGYPSSPDYDGLVVSPGNTLIRDGIGDAQWWTGMLSWNIQLVHK